jgi:hypothetical protein
MQTGFNVKYPLSFLTLDFHRKINNIFFILGFLYGVRREFSEDVSETAAGPIFTGEDRRNVAGKFTSHTA